MDEGFIHCSFAGQLNGVLERYYSEVESVMILGIDPDKLASELVSEPSTGGENYPHIYGPINRNAIVSATERNSELQMATVKTDTFWRFRSRLYPYSSAVRIN